jgi:hypothetical protein
MYFYWGCAQCRMQHLKRRIHPLLLPKRKLLKKLQKKVLILYGSQLSFTTPWFVVA